MQYSAGTSITSAGVTGPFFNALHNPDSTPVTAVVTPFRNQTNNAITIRINGGETLELKVKQVKPTANIIGFS